MTDFDVLYRGVPIPDSVLAPGVFGPNALRDFKLGVDATYAMLQNLNLSGSSLTTHPEPDEYDYFTDGEGDGNEWIWRYRKGAQQGELNKEYAPGWRDSHTPRENMQNSRYDHLRKQELPAWARD